MGTSANVVLVFVSGIRSQFHLCVGQGIPIKVNPVIETNKVGKHKSLFKPMQLSPIRRYGKGNCFVRIRVTPDLVHFLDYLCSLDITTIL